MSHSYMRGCSPKLLTLVMLLGYQLLVFTAYCEPSNKFDNYLTGYVQGVFVHGYGLPKDAVKVKNGIIIVKEGKLGNQNPELIIEKIKQATIDLKGVQGTLVEKDKVVKDYLPKNTGNFDEEYIDAAMPNHSLFQPLIADPKWPRFTVAYQYYFKDRGLKHAFAPNFGAGFPLYRIVNIGYNYEWEIGIQAGLFGLMDIGTKTSALINADYFIGVPITYRAGLWSSLIRFYHISSHLGDEFMLTKEGKKIKRINLSYEGIDTLISYNWNNLRVYGGGGYIVHKEPSYVKPLKLQFGTEYYSPNTFMNGKLRPIMGIDIKTEEQGKWYPGVSCKAGVQLESATLISNKVQLMLEFYSGKSFHGQFYRDKIRYIGIGLQAFL